MKDHRRQPRFDTDERFALDADPENVLRRMLNVEAVPPDENDLTEDEA